MLIIIYNLTVDGMKMDGGRLNRAHLGCIQMSFRILLMGGTLECLKKIYRCMGMFIFSLT